MREVNPICPICHREMTVDSNGRSYRCGKCGKRIYDYELYCPVCGGAIQYGVCEACESKNLRLCMFCHNGKCVYPDKQGASCAGVLKRTDKLAIYTPLCVSSCSVSIPAEYIRIYTRQGYPVRKSIYPKIFMLFLKGLHPKLNIMQVLYS